MKVIPLASLALGLGFATLPAHAATLSQTEIRSIVSNLGFSTMSVELDGNVFEIKATDAGGAPVELHFDATTGQQIGATDFRGSGHDGSRTEVAEADEDRSGSDDGPSHDSGDDHDDDDNSGSGSSNSGSGSSSSGSGGGDSGDDGSDD